MSTATALEDTSALRIGRQSMMQTLHREAALSDRFIAYILARNIRIEEDLVDQLFNSGEKRLARVLLLLARFGPDEGGAEYTVRANPYKSRSALPSPTGD